MTTEQKCCEKVNNKTASKIPRDGSLSVATHQNGNAIGRGGIPSQSSLQNNKCKYCLDTGFMTVKSGKKVRDEPCMYCDAYKK